MTMLEEPEWQYKDGKRVEFESEAYRCKVSTKITQTNMVLLGDEVGGNLDMNGVLHTGGEIFLCEKGCIALVKPTRKPKHSTVIGITNLLGEPICYIVIIEVKEQLFDIWDGIDLSKEKVGYDSDGEECFRMNVVSDKYHPGGTSCTYK